MITHRVWHIPQVPMKPFIVECSTLEQAGKVFEALADYDLFQFENNIKPDYSNASGIEELVDGEWQEISFNEYDYLSE